MPVSLVSRFRITPPPPREFRCGVGRRITTSAAASAGTTATNRASGTVCGRSNSVTGGGTGVCAVVVSVTAGTSSRATIVPSTRPSAAAGTLSSSFSRQ